MAKKLYRDYDPANTPPPPVSLEGSRVTTDYDPIAEQYQRAKQQPWRTWIECHWRTPVLKSVVSPKKVTVDEMEASRYGEV